LEVLYIMQGMVVLDHDFVRKPQKSRFLKSIELEAETKVIAVKKKILFYTYFCNVFNPLHCLTTVLVCPNQDTAKVSSPH